MRNYNKSSSFKHATALYQLKILLIFPANYKNKNCQILLNVANILIFFFFFEERNDLLSMSKLEGCYEDNTRNSAWTI